MTATTCSAMTTANTLSNTRIRWAVSRYTRVNCAAKAVSAAAKGMDATLFHAPYSGQKNWNA